MTQTLEQLRDEATALGIKVHHKHSEDTLREMIALKVNPPEIVQATVIRAEEAAEPEIMQPVRVKMKNNQHHELDVLHENISEYEANGWYVV